jgi:hypothetical protein
MEITIARYFDYEGWNFEDYETDEMNQEQKEELARNLFENNDCQIIKELDNTVENMGADMFAIFEKHKAKKEAETKRRSLAAKKAWAEKRAPCKIDD